MLCMSCYLSQTGCYIKFDFTLCSFTTYLRQSEYLVWYFYYIYTFFCNHNVSAVSPVSLSIPEFCVHLYCDSAACTVMRKKHDRWVTLKLHSMLKRCGTHSVCYLTHCIKLFAILSPRLLHFYILWAKWQSCSLYEHILRRVISGRESVVSLLLIKTWTRCC